MKTNTFLPYDLKKILYIFHFVVCFFAVAAQFQFGSYQKVRLGDKLQVKCKVDKGWNSLVWYKLDTNWRLQMIALEVSPSGLSINNYQSTVESYDTGSTLTVPDVTSEHTGTYYCGINKNAHYLDFSAGTVVVVEGESRSMQSVVQSPDYIKVQPGDSVTLNCSFNTNLCPKENTSLTWIKSDSASQMASWNTGIMSTSCEKRDTGETSCVSNLPLIWKDISSAEDETYFCSLSPAGVVLIVVSVAFAVTVLVLVRLMRKNKKQTRGTSYIHYFITYFYLLNLFLWTV
uniref:Ig-like domain-containing protein n=1 Tax=Periophthalmus magnuspinnatus TaxID=409849 RepID=A0A3B4BH55_9GOBI